MEEISSEETSKAIRRAFDCTLDKALAETARDLLGKAAPDKSSTREAWVDALATIRNRLNRKVEIRQLTRSGCENTVIVKEVEVMRYEIWVDGKVHREVVMTHQIDPPKFFIRTSIVGKGEL